MVPASTQCPHCDAPHEYLYYNDGKRRVHIRCKVCDALFQINKQFRPSKTKYWCPYGERALYRWKDQKLCTIYKCHNDLCPAYLKNIRALNADEKKLQKEKSSQFKLRYQYREYHFDDKLRHSQPDDDGIDLFAIHNSSNIFGLVLAFHVSFAIGARKKQPIFSKRYLALKSHTKPYSIMPALPPGIAIDSTLFIKEISTMKAPAMKPILKLPANMPIPFSSSRLSRKISAYHVDDSRDTLPATIATNEAARTALPDQKRTFITDGNPSYPAGLHYLNSKQDPENPIDHQKVIGL